jgi:hypothetical protein
MQHQVGLRTPQGGLPLQVRGLGKQQGAIEANSIAAKVRKVASVRNNLMIQSVEGCNMEWPLHGLRRGRSCMQLLVNVAR